MTDVESAGAAAWQSEEKQHFRVEEELLLPAYAVHGDPADPIVMRMLQDHMLIRRDAERVANAPSVELSHNTADAISSTLPKRPIGSCAIMLAYPSGAPAATR